MLHLTAAPASFVAGVPLAGIVPTAAPLLAEVLVGALVAVFLAELLFRPVEEAASVGDTFAQPGDPGRAVSGRLADDDVGDAWPSPGRGAGAAHPAESRPPH